MAANIGGALFNSSSDKYTTASYISAHQITSSMTIAITAKPSALPASGGYAFLAISTGPGELEADNGLYAIGIHNVSGTNYWTSFHESGAGTNHLVDSDIVVGGVGVEQTIVLIRDNSAKTIRFVVDGVDGGAFGYSANPTGGTTSKIIIGQSLSAGQEFSGTLKGLAIWNTAITVAQAQAYNAVYTGGLENLSSFVNDIATANLVSYYPLTDADFAIDIIAANHCTGTNISVADFTTSFTSVNMDPNAQQGYTTDATYHYISDTTALHKRNDDGTWSVAASNTSPFASLSGSPDHIGDICTDGTYVYAPVDDYPGTSAKQLVRYLCSDLSYHSHITLGSTRGTSGVAIDVASGLLYVSDYATDVIDIYTTAFVYQSTINITPTHTAIQGITFKNGWLYVVATTGALMIVRPSSGEIVYRKDLGSFHEYEGLDYTQGELRYLYDSGAGSADQKVKYLTDVPFAAPAAVSTSMPPNRNRYTQALHH